MQQGVGQKSTVQDRHRAIRDLVPERSGQGDLPRIPTTESEPSEQMRAQHHECHGAYLRVTRFPAPSTGSAEGTLVFGSVRDA